MSANTRVFERKRMRPGKTITKRTDALSKDVDENCRAYTSRTIFYVGYDARTYSSLNVKT